jgi:hypothetical protein
MKVLKIGARILSIPLWVLFGLVMVLWLYGVLFGEVGCWIGTGHVFDFEAAVTPLTMLAESLYEALKG